MTKYTLTEKNGEHFAYSDKSPRFCFLGKTEEEVRQIAECALKFYEDYKNKKS
jgi:predicted RNase H-like HicB family nuclease